MDHYFYWKSDKRFHPQLLQAKLRGPGGESALHSMSWRFVSGLYWNIELLSPIIMQLAKCWLVWQVWMKSSQVMALCYFAHPWHCVEQTLRRFASPKLSWRIWQHSGRPTGNPAISGSFRGLRLPAHELSQPFSDFEHLTAAPSSRLKGPHVPLTVLSIIPRHANETECHFHKQF